MTEGQANEVRTRRVGRAARVGLMRVTLILGGIIVGLVLAEAAVRVLDLGPDVMSMSHGNFRISQNRVLRYELKPGSVDGSDRISDQGLRDRTYQMPKPAGTFRVAVVGDSIAFGFGISQEETLSRRLEAALHGRGFSRVEVLNFGVTAYNIEQIAEVCRAKVAAAGADMILYVYCLNDPQDYSFEWETLRAKLSKADRGYRRTLVGDGGSRLVSMLKYVLASYAGDSGSGEVVSLDPGAVALSRGDYVGYFRALYKTGEPKARLMKGLDVLKEAIDLPVAIVVFPVFRDLDSYSLTDIHEIVSRAAGERGLPVLDLLETYRSHVLRGGGRCWLDELHPDGRGVLSATDRIADWLVSQGLVD